MTHRAATLFAAGLVLLATACGRSTGDISRVVIVTFDTTRADRIGTYGYAEAETPNLDRFAAESVLFEQAVSPVPTTLPSHSTLFTGLYPQDHGVRYNIVFRLGPEARTLAESFSEAGYGTGGFPASFILDRRFGLDQGFDEYVRPPKPGSADADHPDATYRRAADGVDDALAWLREQQRDRQFVWLHFYDPHAPYAPPFPYSSRFRDRLYDGEIAYADAQFGRFVDALRDDPEWDSTLLIVAGDHGEGLYDHRERFHSYLTYESTQRVPLIIRAPGARAARVAEPVGLADVMPTVLDLTGVEPPGEMRGVSLRPALEGRDLPRRDIYFESVAGALNFGWAELTGVRFGQWKLIDSPDPELYDLAADPGELTNLASIEPERIQELREALSRLADPISAESFAEEAQEPVLDAETEAFLASLGYVGGGAGGSSVEGAPHPRTMIDVEGEMMAARKAIGARRWDLLEELGRYVLDRDPTNKRALKNLSTALIAMDRAAEAQDLSAELVRLYPDLPHGYAMLARAYNAQNESRTAREVLGRGLAALPDSEMLVYLSLVAGFDVGDPVCDGEVVAAMEQHPTSSRLMVLRARCEVRAGRAEAALVTIREAVDLGFVAPEVILATEEFADVVRLPGWGAVVEAVEERKARRADGDDGADETG